MSVMNTNSKAAIPNPALKPLEPWVGRWSTQGTHPQFPDTVLHGSANFAWMEGGAFLIMHAQIDHDKFPDTISVFGSDDKLGGLYMLSFDERGVSRKQEVAIQGNVLRWWRNAPGFSQRYTFTFADDGDTIISKGELSKDHVSWERDLDLTYTRIRS
jgi:hypothetical protein